MIKPFCNISTYSVSQHFSEEAVAGVGKGTVARAGAGAVAEARSGAEALFSSHYLKQSSYNFK